MAPLIAVSQAEQSKLPTIHTGTYLVQVNVVVDDRGDHPVADLTKDDFVITDRGKPQKISVFSMDSVTALLGQAQPLPQNTFSDENQFQGEIPNGITIVLLDNLNTLTGSSPQPYENTPYWLEDLALSSAKQHLIQFLKQLDSKEYIAIYGLTDRLHVLCDFTCDREQLLAAVTKYDSTSKTTREAAEPGAFHTPVPGPQFNAAINADTQQLAAFNNQARAQATMAALAAIADHVADIPGRKNLIWLTSNLPFSGDAIARILSRGSIAAYPVDARGLLSRTPQENLEGLVDEDAYARGALGRPPAASSRPIGIDTMLKMADSTGGRAFVNSNDLTGAIRKAIEDAAVTYTLGFYIDRASLDDKSHELRVQVRRSGLNVRYPKSYFAWKDLSASERRNSIVTAIRSPLDSSAIPLLVKVDRVEQPNPHSLRILASIGLKPVQLTQDGGFRTGAVDVYVVEQDAAGSVLSHPPNHVRLKLTDEQYRAYLQSGIHVREYVQLGAATTTLRVLVEDANTSQVGSVIIPLGRVN